MMSGESSTKSFFFLEISISIKCFFDEAVGRAVTPKLRGVWKGEGKYEYLIKIKVNEEERGGIQDYIFELTLVRELRVFNTRRTATENFANIFRRQLIKGK